MAAHPHRPALHPGSIPSGMRRGLETAAIMTDWVAYYGRRGYQIIRTGPPPHRRDEHPRVFLEKELK